MKNILQEYIDNLNNSISNSSSEERINALTNNMINAFDKIGSMLNRSFSNYYMSFYEANQNLVAPQLDTDANSDDVVVVDLSPEQNEDFIISNIFNKEFTLPFGEYILYLRIKRAENTESTDSVFTVIFSKDGESCIERIRKCDIKDGYTGIAVPFAFLGGNNHNINISFGVDTSSTWNESDIYFLDDLTIRPNYTIAPL